jgi:acyl carrier protein phosphodiesterase
MARRLSRGELLANSGEELRRNYETFEAGFLAFFPELVGYVKTL